MIQKIDYPNNGGPCRESGLPPRIETGAVQFGTDWPGLFIRGDDSFHTMLSINAIVEQLKNTKISFEAQFALDWLKSLAETIQEDVVVK